MARAEWFDTIWRKFLGRPPRRMLAVAQDSGEGRPVVLLHGIATDHASWKFAFPHISRDCRLIALDLLGFGDSPKPDDIEYNVEDHAKAVIATLRKMGIRKNAVLVGHSMGTLIAVEIARQNPKLTGRLILCSPPIFRFDKKHRLRPNQMTLLSQTARYLQHEKRAMRTIGGFKRIRPDLGKSWGVTKATWIGFKQSLQHTIMEQTTFDDVQELSTPVEMLAGRFDGLIIKKNLQEVARLAPSITLRWLNEPHKITRRYGQRIGEAVNRTLE